mgnify:CR=1 FL=1
MNIPFATDYRRIATEEAWCPHEMLDLYREQFNTLAEKDAGFRSLWQNYLESDGERARFIRSGLINMDEQRLAHMDAAGVDMAILALTSPGVQPFERDLAVSFARRSNDILADCIARHPDRFAGLTAIAPHDPKAAADEIERGHGIGLRGVIINSHTQHTYLDDRNFEAAEAKNTPIYLHPNTPSKGMFEPLFARGLDGAIFGFAVETATHTLRLILSGVFDRFPNLKLVIGHGGEGLPFWLYRLDYMHAAIIKGNRYETVIPLRRKVSEYLRENVWITTSGQPWAPAIEFCIRVLGEDRVMYAMDYPYEYVPEEVTLTEEIEVSDEVRKKFFQTNAEAVFSL